MIGGVEDFGLRVESYMLELLYNLVVQSIRFTNIKVIKVVQYLNVVHAHIAQYNIQ
jgi:hypothetical protein